MCHTHSGVKTRAHLRACLFVSPIAHKKARSPGAGVHSACMRDCSDDHRRKRRKSQVKISVSTRDAAHAGVIFSRKRWARPPSKTETFLRRLSWSNRIARLRHQEL